VLTPQRVALLTTWHLRVLRHCTPKNVLIEVILMAK